MRPGLRALLLLLLGALHAAVAALGALALAGRPWGALLLEAGLVASMLVSAALVRALFAPLDILRTGAELLREGDFTARIARTGLPEMDALADVYNRMADRLRAERTRLVEQDLFLSRLVDASPAGVVTLGFDGAVRLVSPSAAALLGADAAGCEGLPLRECPGLAASLAEIEPGASRLLQRDGRRLRVRRAEFHDRGFPRTFFLVEEMTDELQAAERAAHERIVQVMAHEVRNTVGVVRSLLESVAPSARELPDPRRRDFDEALGIASRRLLGLNAFMNAVADVVRLPPPRREPCDVAALVREMAGLMAPEAESRGLSLGLECAEPLQAPLDKNQIEQVLLNVLRNAFEATPAGGCVTVSLRRPGGIATLSVRDGGPGIPADVVPRLFTPFFTTRPGGRGVGLMLVREILQGHGLPFSLRSHPDGGAEFVVRFERDG